MDNSVLHLIITALLGAVVATIGYLVKATMDRIKDLEDNLNEHKIDDASKWSEFAAHKTEVSRRLQVIDSKLDKLLER